MGKATVQADALVPSPPPPAGDGGYFASELRVGANRRSRVALFYPWADLRQGGTGAAVRVNQLLDYLGTHGVEVRVLQDGGDAYRHSAAVEVSSHRLAKAPRLLRTFAKLFGGLVGEERSTTDQLLRFYRADGDPTFLKRASELVDWADAVIIEYPFNVRAILSMRRERGKPIILTAHDILAEQVQRSGVLRRWLSDLETRAFRSVDWVVTVSDADRQRVLSAGAPAAATAPQPVVVGPCEAAPEAESTAWLAACPGGLATTRFCLFVGGNFHPNLLAVRRIRDIAARCANIAGLKDLRFVLAGRCAPAAVDGSVIGLGAVTQELLRALYHAATLVLVPLELGTGASVKTLEALAAGKAVLGTSVAFRGYAVHSERDCVILDDFSAYPDAIAMILSDRDRAEHLAAGARAYARHHSPDSALQAYSRILAGIMRSS